MPTFRSGNSAKVAIGSTGAATGTATRRPRYVPFFPARSGLAFRTLIHKTESGELAGKQVDWGAWAANVTKQQILDFVDAV